MNVDLETIPPQGHFAAVNGIDLYYESYGEGTPLLLLHGFLNSSLQWHSFVSDFSKHFRLIIPDMRGHGRSVDAENRFTFGQAALDILLLLDQLGIERCKAIGDSGGGGTLQLMASWQPERFDTIVIIESSPDFSEEMRATVLAELDFNVVDLTEWQHYHRHGVNQVRALILCLTKIMDEFNAQPPQISKITAKTLLVYGDHDELMPVSVPQQMYNTIPHAYLWIVPNAHHAFMIVHPQRHAAIFTQIALEFLQETW